MHKLEGATMLISFIHSVLTFFEGGGNWGNMLGLMIVLIP
ncbi:DedA family protein, partial [Bacillus cereus]|nr:DedA family protein [Bacillus cereus]